jgi:hypothetical protein
LIASGSAHTSGDGKRFVVRADEKLTAFIELERTIQCPGRHNTAIRIN